MTEVDRLPVIARKPVERRGLSIGRMVNGIWYAVAECETVRQAEEVATALNDHQGAVDRVAVLESAVRGLLGAGPSWPVPDTREAILAARHGVQS